MSVSDQDAAAMIAYLRDLRAVTAISETMAKSWAYQINAAAPWADKAMLNEAVKRLMRGRGGQSFRRDIEAADVAYQCQAIRREQVGMDRSQLVQGAPPAISSHPQRLHRWAGIVAELLAKGAPLERARAAASKRMGVRHAPGKAVPAPANFRAQIAALTDSVAPPKSDHGQIGA